LASCCSAWGGPKLHFFATLMVALGTTISAAWILAANSWMHTPHGVVYDAIAGKFEVINRLQVIFNPSYLVRLAAAFCQGLAAGALLSGSVIVEHERFVGSALDVFTWFNLLMGLTAVTAYATLGAGWSYWKTEAKLQQRQKDVLQNVPIVFLVITTSSCIFSIGFPRVAQLWNIRPTPFIVFGMLSFVFWMLAFKSIKGKSDRGPLQFSMGAVAVLLIGLVSVLWLYVVPYSITYGSAAASRESQLIIIVGTAVMLPVVLGYNVTGRLRESLFVGCRGPLQDGFMRDNYASQENHGFSAMQ
jgi:hypothetical protein